MMPYHFCSPSTSRAEKKYRLTYILPALVSRLLNSLLMSFAETGHFQGGVKLPPRRSAPLR